MRQQSIVTILHGMIICVACCAGCAALQPPELAIDGGEPVIYLCETGETITARYFSLSDGSLHFVKLTLPDGREYTLPNVVSASGARYTDDRELVWWIKGDGAFAQTRDDTGAWVMLYRNCKVRK